MDQFCVTWDCTLVCKLVQVRPRLPMLFKKNVLFNDAVNY